MKTKRVALFLALLVPAAAQGASIRIGITLSESGELIDKIEETLDEGKEKEVVSTNGNTLSLKAAVREGGKGIITLWLRIKGRDGERFLMNEATFLSGDTLHLSESEGGGPSKDAKVTAILQK